MSEMVLLIPYMINHKTEQNKLFPTRHDFICDVQCAWANIRWKS